MISIDTWLRSFGFHTNPFETTEAGSEVRYATEFLHATFVKPIGFDEILGNPDRPKSSLVFASRGKGKSSTRLMTAHFCKSGLFPGQENEINEAGYVKRVLPVHYTRFEKLFEFSDNSIDLVNAHVDEILHRAVSAFINMLLEYSDISSQVTKADIHTRLDLQLFLVLYQTYASIGKLKEARDILGKEIINYDKEHKKIGFLLPKDKEEQTGLSQREIELYLQMHTQLSPIDQIALFTSLLSQVGIGAVYVLIDGIDEIAKTVDDFNAAADVLLPLLANLNLMNNTPNLAFKVFLPEEMRQTFLEASNKVRQDRISIYYLNLDDSCMYEILTRRLEYSSNDVVTSMDAVCVPEYRGKIETEIVERSFGNPRRLIWLGYSMIVSRCEIVNENDDEENYQLTKRDLDDSERMLPKELTAGLELPEIEPKEANTKKHSDVDKIILSDIKWFRHELPAPIAVSYLLYERETDPTKRLWRMYELIEASLAFLAQILLSILHQHLNSTASKKLRNSGLRLDRTSIGSWRIALEKLPGMLAGSGVQSLFAIKGNWTNIAKY